MSLMTDPFPRDFRCRWLMWANHQHHTLGRSRLGTARLAGDAACDFCPLEFQPVDLNLVFQPMETCLGLLHVHPICRPTQAMALWVWCTNRCGDVLEAKHSRATSPPLFAGVFCSTTKQMYGRLAVGNPAVMQGNTPHESATHCNGSTDLVQVHSPSWPLGPAMHPSYMTKSSLADLLETSQLSKLHAPRARAHPSLCSSFSCTDEALNNCSMQCATSSNAAPNYCRHCASSRTSHSRKH
jgi:hypothetical protein